MAGDSPLIDALDFLDELAHMELLGLLEVETGDDGSVRCRPTEAGAAAVADVSEAR